MDRETGSAGQVPTRDFFAAILFVQYLQFAIGAEDSLQNMRILFMGVSPVAALLGANFYLRRESASTSN